MTNNEIRAGNIRMAEFMGWELRYSKECEKGQYYLVESAGSNWIMHNDGGGSRFDLWNPHTDLNQAMQVVDKICKQTGWTDGNGSQGEDNVSYFAIFEKYHQDQWIPFILGESEIRVQAISIACLKAIDHIEKQTS